MSFCGSDNMKLMNSLLHQHLSQVYRRLHLGMDIRQKACSDRVPDMTCFAAKHLKFDSRQFVYIMF